MSAGPPHRGRAGAWGVADIPDQRGRAAVVTGATSGIGLAVATALAGAGAAVILTGRSAERGATALATVREQHPDANVSFEAADQADLAAVRALAARVGSRWQRLDLLVCNAGIMALPTRRVSADGVELQFAVNHLSHFALTARLWPVLAAAPAARIIVVASNAHWSGSIDFASFGAAGRYAPRRAYAQSKLANLLFALELHRRIVAAGAPATSLAAHPGIAATDLFAADQGSDNAGPGRRLRSWLATGFIRRFAQSAADGALPVLFAATAPDAAGGSYTGPASWAEWRGPPAPARLAPEATDPEVARRLWQVSEDLAGIAFPLPPNAPAGVAADVEPV